MPRLRRGTIQRAILVIWLVGLMASVVAIATVYSSIETQFTRVLAWVIGAFAPTIGVMLGVVYARRNELKPQVDETATAAWLAIALSLLYVAAVTVLVLAFVTNRIQKVDAFLETGEVVRALSVLVVAPIAFYFGEPNPIAEAVEGGRSH